MENQYKITVIVFSSSDVRTQVLQTKLRSQKSAGRTLTAYDDTMHQSQAKINSNTTQTVNWNFLGIRITAISTSDTSLNVAGTTCCTHAGQTLQAA